jgi:ribosomal protein L7/L12
MSDSERLIALQYKVAELERKLDFVLNHLNLRYTENALSLADSEAAKYLRLGNKIEAIKAYRAVTNAGLAEAKQAVDALEMKLKMGS